MIKSQKIILTGTHLTPALEFIHQLQQDREFDWKIFYFGRNYNSSVSQDKSIESKIIPKIGVKFYGLDSGKLDRRWLPNTLQGIPHIFRGFWQAYKTIQEIKPKYVLSFGGYLSVPVVFAAWLQKIPCLTHEQTSTLSLSTKINALFCQKVALSFPIANDSSKYVLTGNLLRREIFSTNSKLFKKLIPEIKKYPLIFLTAGNQGSHHLNLILKEILPILSQKYTIIHQCGEEDYFQFKKFANKFKHYYPYPYIESPDIGWLFHYSQIIISRSGANTTQELMALHKKCLLIPLPVSQQNEQLKNALYLKTRSPKSTIIIKDTEVSAENLLNNINKLIKIKTKNKTLPLNSNLKLLNLLKKL
ncbi:MAG: glycosyltransferase [Candidatus Shapirobacteria bacterium]|jgi:UDP-N-acetylglucosamine--N-acetylmuramyl-(pentapeptide) pyrophosphoryl-undecaprenol N-acetylglucosamine transferase